MLKKAKGGNSDALYDAKIERTIIRAEIANSYGARTTFDKTSFEGYIYGSITREGDVIGIYEADSSGAFENQPEEWADVTVKKLNDAIKVVNIPAGDYPCILMPKAMDIFGPLLSALNARMVLKDMSPFKDKVGEQIMDPRINIDDDGLYGRMPGTQPVDDEGITSQVTPLIKNGVLMGFIHDLHTAKKMGVQPTGNGMRAGLAGNPRAGYSTLVLRPGDKSLDELIAGIKKGVLIDQIMGAHQASPFSGDFSVSINLGYVIEDGKIIGRFKDGMLAGNAFRMLKDQLVEIGSELKYTGPLAPPILLDRMTVATAG
jgi:PmbA protein